MGILISERRTTTLYFLCILHNFKGAGLLYDASGETKILKNKKDKKMAFRIFTLSLPEIF